jgi:hypothetical protein
MDEPLRISKDLAGGWRAVVTADGIALERRDEDAPPIALPWRELLEHALEVETRREFRSFERFRRSHLAPEGREGPPPRHNGG